MFKEIIPFNTEIHTLPVNISAQVLNVKAGDTNSYHWALKSQIISVQLFKITCN